MADVKISYVGLNGVEAEVHNGETIKTYNPLVEAVSGTSFTLDLKDVADNELVILVTASANATVTFKAGELLQGVEDLEVPVKSGQTAICIESGKFKKKNGKVDFTSSASVSVGAVARY